MSVIKIGDVAAKFMDDLYVLPGRSGAVCARLVCPLSRFGLAGLPRGGDGLPGLSAAEPRTSVQGRCLCAGSFCAAHIFRAVRASSHLDELPLVSPASTS